MRLRYWRVFSPLALLTRRCDGWRLPTVGATSGTRLPLQASWASDGIAATGRRVFLGLACGLAGTTAVGLARGAEPEIVQPPLKLTASVDGAARFMAGVTGSEPITCLWFHEGVLISTSAGDATLTLSNVQEADRGQYWLVAQNAAGSVTSAPVVLTVMPRVGTERFDAVVNNGAGNMPGMKHNFFKHSNHLVPLQAKGQGAELFHPLATNTDPVRGPYVDNTDIHRVMRAALTNGVKNIILMISDGAGYSTFEAASYYQHGELGRQVYDDWPVQYACSTYPLSTASSPSTNTAPASTRGWYDGNIWQSFYLGTRNWTDSASAATAQSCGQKTFNFSICWSDDNQPMENISDTAKRAFGKKVGVVTTVQFSFATPTCFSAHNPSRMAFQAIASEQFTSDIVDVLMGAGHPFYDDNNTVTSVADYRFVGGQELWNSMVSGALGWNLIQTRAEFDALAGGTLAPGGRIFGLAHVRSTLQQGRTSAGGGQEAAFVAPFNPEVPDLPTMTRGALRALANGNPNGFFMMIEGGAVDFANESWQQGRMIEEQVDFNHAVEAVVSWVAANGGWEENLVIVTADHETGLLFGPTAGGVPTLAATSLSPSGIASLATSHGTADLSWSAVLGATRYLLNVTQPDLAAVSYVAVTNRFSLTNLSVGTYSWTVTAVNDFGRGPASAASSLSVLVHGLVGVGRIPADAFDARGPGIDSLGGLGSAAFFDASTWMRTPREDGQYAYSGKLYCAADRGFGDGTQNFQPRIQTMDLCITPDYGTAPVPQTQVVLGNTATLLLSCGGAPFTGYDADDSSVQDYPQSSPGSVGQGHRSLDPEGLVRLADGSYFLCDEYGPFIGKFSAQGELEYTMWPPDALRPKLGDYPGRNWFTSTNSPNSGRRENRGLEGLSITPDGTRLFAMLESPTIQDGGVGKLSRYTRVLVFDIVPDSPTFRQPVEEYAYALTLNGSNALDAHTPVNEILALNSADFLVLECDQVGPGSGTNAPLYKRIVLASTVGATNIINTAYDLEKGAPGQLAFRSDSLPTKVAPVSRVDLVDLLDPKQLARFGLNTSTHFDGNTLAEKWASLALIPLNDPEATNDFLLLTLCDNDFRAPVVYHNGVPVGTNDVAVDSMALAYRVRLPMYGMSRPTNQPPGVVMTPSTNVVLSTTAALTLAAHAYDQDGRVTRVAFYEGGNWIGEATRFPFQIVLSHWPPGVYDFMAVATDNEGLSTSSSVLAAAVKMPDIPLVLAIAWARDPGTGSDTVTVSFDTVIGEHYQAWAATEITGPWRTLASRPITGTGLTATCTDISPGPRQTFYRAVRLD